MDYIVFQHRGAFLDILWTLGKRSHGGHPDSQAPEAPARRPTQVPRLHVQFQHPSTTVSVFRDVACVLKWPACSPYLCYNV